MGERVQLMGERVQLLGERAVFRGSDGMKITVLIADDHAMFRDGMRRLLESEEDIQVVAEAADGHEAIRQAK